MWTLRLIGFLVALIHGKVESNFSTMLVHLRAVINRFPMAEIPWNELVIYCQEDCSMVLKIHPEAKITQNHSCWHQETIVTAELPRHQTFGNCAWIIYETKEHEQILDGNVPPFQSRVYLFKLLDEHMFEIWETYQVGFERRKNLVHTWKKNTLMFQNNPLLERRSCLKEAHFEVIMADWKPFQFVEGYDVENANGFSIEILKNLQSALNFSYTLSGSEFQIQGDIFKNGSSYGLLGSVTEGKFDFGATVIIMSEERSKSLNLIYVGTSIKKVIISWIPDASGINDAVLSMFTKEVWAVYGLSLILLIAYGFMISLIGRQDLIPMDHTEVGLAVLGCLFGQGVSRPLSLISFRILLITTFLLGLMFSITFSARLISSLSVQNQVNKLATLEQVEAEKVEMFIPGFGADYTLYSEASSDSVIGRLWQNKICRSPEFYANPYSFEALLGYHSKEAVALGYQNVVDVYRSKNPELGCKIQTSGIPYFNGRLYFPFRPNFQYVEVFKFQLQKMEQAGIIDKMVKKWVKAQSYDEGYLCHHHGPNDGVIPIKFTSVTKFFFTLAFGILLGLVLLIVEVAMYSKTNVQCAFMRIRRRICSTVRNFLRFLE